MECFIVRNGPPESVAGLCLGDGIGKIPQKKCPTFGKSCDGQIPPNDARLFLACSLEKGQTMRMFRNIRDATLQWFKSWLLNVPHGSLDMTVATFIYACTRILEELVQKGLHWVGENYICSFTKFNTNKSYRKVSYVDGHCKGNPSKQFKNKKIKTEFLEISHVR